MTVISYVKKENIVMQFNAVMMMNMMMMQSPVSGGRCYIRMR